MRSGEDLIETLGSSYAAFTRLYEPCCQAEPHRGGRLGVRMEFFDPAPINAFNKTPIAPAAVERRCPDLIARGTSGKCEASRQSGK